MKVAVSGAHGTGKTTLLNALQRSQGSAIQVIPETPRILVDLAGDPTYLRRGRNSVLNQVAILARQMSVEAQRATDAVMVCDRTVADHWAYTCLLFPEEINSPALLLVEQGVRDWLHTYDQIFLVRPEFPVQDDGTREDSRDFQYDVDAFLNDYYSRAAIPVTYLSGTVEERLATFIREVRA